MEIAQKSLKTKEAPEPGSVEGYCIKMMKDILIESKLPELWKYIEVQYIPICLLNDLWQILDYLLAKRLREKFRRSRKLTDFQFKSHPARSNLNSFLAEQPKAKDIKLIFWGFKEFSVIASK